MEFSLEQWHEIKKHCEDAGVEFLCSPFSNMSVDWLIDLNVQKYQIGSGEVGNFLMLEKIAKTGKEIILSTGMSTFDEVDETINFLKQFDNKIYPNVFTAFYQTKKCKEKYSKYICECTGPFSEQNKRFHCSILATH